MRTIAFEVFAIGVVMFFAGIYAAEGLVWHCVFEFVLAGIVSLGVWNNLRILAEGTCRSNT